MRPCVRLSDTTVPRFNSPAEPARTVSCPRFNPPAELARTVGFGKRDSKTGTVASVCDHWTQGKRKEAVDAEKSDGKKKRGGGRREK